MKKSDPVDVKRGLPGNRAVSAPCYYSEHPNCGGGAQAAYAFHPVPCECRCHAPLPGS